MTNGRAVIPTLHIPLRRLALCLDCEACFDIQCRACPGCGGGSWVLLAGFLQTPRSHPRRARALGLDPAIPLGAA